MVLVTFPADPVLGAVQAQQVFDTTDEGELARVVSMLSQQFRQFTNRVRITAGTVQEVVRPAVCSSFIYLHSTVDTAETISIKEYSGGSLVRTLVKDTDFVVYGTEWSARLDMLTTTLQAGGPGQYTTIDYTGGWDDATMPGDITAGAIMQGRVNLKRLRGDVGALGRKRGADSRDDIDQHGIIRTVADLWRPYKIMI